MIRIEISCDDCGADGGLTNSTPLSAEEDVRRDLSRLRRKGWTATGEKVNCPECTTARLPRQQDHNEGA